MKVADLNRINQRQIARAGPRYGPSLDPAAPNIPIAPLLAALDALAYSARLQNELARLAQHLEESVERTSHITDRLFRGRARTPAKLAEILYAFRAVDPRAADPFLREIRAIHGSVRRRLRDEHGSLLDRQRQVTDRDERQHLDSAIYGVRTLSESTEELEMFAESPAFSLLDHNALLILGEWGTGKTHFLCDVTRQRMDEGLPSLLYLASNIPTGVNPLDGLCTATGLAGNRKRLLSDLQNLGVQARGRTLLIIDGINEGDRDQWRRTVSSLVREIQEYPNVGLVLSCRDPFQRLIFSARTLRRYVQLTHPGFADIEFNAQLEFFTYYGIDAPGYPLITPEFSRPLFLKLLCTALTDLASKTRKLRFKEITAGQKGMTYILEHFVDSVGKQIEDDFDLARGSCWRALKGSDSPTGEVQSLAGTLARDLSESLSRAECLSILRSSTGLSTTDAKRFLHRLLVDGLLAEGIRWNTATGTPQEVIQFPYQRFGDHLVARHLLVRHLATTSEASIRRSFYANRPLGQVFTVDKRGDSFRLPGLAAAIMLEFPERIKRVAALRDRELLSFLPKRCLLVAPLREVFLDGLHWRPSDSFSHATDRAFDFFLRDPNTRNAALEVAVVLAARPEHPYSADRLYRYLAAMTMPDRDLIWTEFLRQAPPTATWQRLVRWVEKNSARMTDPSVRKNTILLLALFLTTTYDEARDNVTHALFLLGLHDPETLFAQTAAALGFNDPYLPERMLAASYGIAMNLWADPKGQRLRASIVPFAQSLMRDMFLPGAAHATTHTLTRDYALGVIELARRISPGMVRRGERRYVVQPFAHLPSPFQPAEEIGDEVVADTERAIHMDFGNYTMGGLVRGRQNYEFGDTEYKLIRRQILGRMAELGYSYKRFGTVDAEISRRSSSFGHQESPGKVDRYGKKYSWIAFFEMYGVREAQGELDEHREGWRTSDCDIDPSFPEPAPTWVPPLPALFSSPYTEPMAWLEDGPHPDYESLLELPEVDGLPGPWVLLDGFIAQGATEDPRDVFTFLRGLLVRPRDIGRLTWLVNETPYPANRRVPEPGEDYYTYAGEVPWSRRFGTSLRQRNGRAKAHLDMAFDRYEGPRWIGELPVEVPIHNFAWESYHSNLNQAGHVVLPAPLLCERLGLVNHRQTFDLFDRSGRQATVYRHFRASDYSDSWLLYMRSDLVNRYLRLRGRTLAWIPWGERRFHYKQYDRLAKEIQGEAWRVHKGILAYGPR